MAPMRELSPPAVPVMARGELVLRTRSHAVSRCSKPGQGQQELARPAARRARGASAHRRWGTARAAPSRRRASTAARISARISIGVRRAPMPAYATAGEMTDRRSSARGVPRARLAAKVGVADHGVPVRCAAGCRAPGRTPPRRPCWARASCRWRDQNRRGSARRPRNAAAPGAGFRCDPARARIGALRVRHPARDRALRGSAATFKDARAAAP